jgi:hypothetical protein
MDLIKSWKIENQQLVITSGFDLDDNRQRDVYIKDVYKKSGNLLQLQNNKLTFITKDGSHLTPELPETLEADHSTDIQTVISRQKYELLCFAIQCANNTARKAVQSQYSYHPLPGLHQ